MNEDPTLKPNLPNKRKSEKYQPEKENIHKYNLRKTKIILV